MIHVKDSSSEPENKNFMEWERDKGIEKRDACVGEDESSSADPHVAPEYTFSPKRTGDTSQKRKSSFTSPLREKISRDICNGKQEYPSVNETNLCNNLEVASGSSIDQPVPQMTLLKPHDISSQATRDNISTVLVNHDTHCSKGDISTDSMSNGEYNSFPNIDVVRRKIIRLLDAEELRFDTEGTSTDTEYPPVETKRQLPDTEESSPETGGLSPDKGTSPDAEDSPSETEEPPPNTEKPSLHTEGSSPDIEGSSPDAERSSPDAENPQSVTEGAEAPETEGLSPETEGSRFIPPDFPNLSKQVLDFLREHLITHKIYESDAVYEEFEYNFPENEVICKICEIYGAAISPPLSPPSTDSDN